MISIDRFIIIVLVLAVLYLFNDKLNSKEGMANMADVDITAIKSLSDIAQMLQKDGELTIPGNLKVTGKITTHDVVIKSQDNTKTKISLDADGNIYAGGFNARHDSTQKVKAYMNANGFVVVKSPDGTKDMASLDHNGNFYGGGFNARHDSTQKVKAYMNANGIVVVKSPDGTKDMASLDHNGNFYGGGFIAKDLDPDTKNKNLASIDLNGNIFFTHGVYKGTPAENDRLH
jgi:hypothetical protein